MVELSVLSGVSQPTLRKLDRMNTETLGGVQLRPLLKLAMFLECSAVDLVPFLATRLKLSHPTVGRHITGGQGRPKRSGKSHREAIEQRRTALATKKKNPSAADLDLNEPNHPEDPGAASPQ